MHLPVLCPPLHVLEVYQNMFVLTDTKLASIRAIFQMYVNYIKYKNIKFILIYLTDKQDEFFKYGKNTISKLIYIINIILYIHTHNFRVFLNQNGQSGKYS